MQTQPPVKGTSYSEDEKIINTTIPIDPDDTSDEDDDEGGNSIINDDGNPVADEPGDLDLEDDTILDEDFEEDPDEDDDEDI